jgi:mannose-1-phosphate guanylyltransferase
LHFYLAAKCAEQLSVTDSWCVLLASRQSLQRSALIARESNAPHRPPTPIKRDHLAAALRRAASVASHARIAAVVAVPPECLRECALQDLETRNLFVQPKHQGTAFEVLFALLQLEQRVAPATPVLFLPADHVVHDEEVMNRALVSMIEWIRKEPRPVYLLGAVPQGPHDQLGYIVPWHDSMQMPTSVYEFVERPDLRRARKLINAGGLWNTFIFGGTLSSLIKLFPSGFDAAVAALRSALRAGPNELDALLRVYSHLTTVDFSRDVLATQIDHLHVLPLPSCGWWPLKSPELNRHLHSGASVAP